ncbi:hypothetical protein H8959_008270 [Pygathrix nigripes]
MSTIQPSHAHNGSGGSAEQLLKVQELFCSSAKRRCHRARLCEKAKAHSAPCTSRTTGAEPPEEERAGSGSPSPGAGPKRPSSPALQNRDLVSPVYRSACRTHQKPPRLSADLKSAFSGGPESAQFTSLGTARLSFGAGAGPLQPKGAPEAQDIA